MIKNEEIKQVKIAVISDIHGNYQALKAIINDIEEEKTDYIICLGDIIGKGINSRRCIDLIKEKCSLVLRGNVDDRFCRTPEDFKNDENEYNRIKFYQQFLTNDDINYLNNLPIFTEFYLSGNLIRLFHASLDDVYTTIENYEMDFTKKYKLFEPNEYTVSKVADMVIFGHLHYNFMEKIYGKTLINCGSVGCSGCPILKEGYNSKEEISNAHYLILTGNLNDINNGNIGYYFKSVVYDKDTEIKESNELNNIDYGYENLLREGYYPGLPNIMKKISENGYKLIK